MIPRVCLNCDWCEPLLANVNEPIPADCHALPLIVRIDDSRVHPPCKFFAMCAPARIEIPDIPTDIGTVEQEGAIDHEEHSGEAADE